MLFESGKLHHIDVKSKCLKFVDIQECVIFRRIMSFEIHIKLRGNVSNNLDNPQFLLENIRIFGWEVLIENSVRRVTVRHHEAYRVMPNSYPSDGIFNLHRRTIMNSFSCILFLRQLHLDLNISCFINFTLK